ncbi:nucleotidyltransferase [Staphylococcus auricularis]|uniref:nucleotidyltransferase n=1 Tax=Staphylococcus auricularis TaxID=29379 RepID=UPI003EBA292C
MKSVALITEYNPFHNGHVFHAQQAKQLTQADVTIAIMSGSFVMRGEPAIYNKFTRATMALDQCDLVVELPAFASLSAGEYFGDMAVQLAHYLDSDALVFGSESGDTDAFLSISQQLNDLKARPIFQQKIKEGKSYPRILSELFPNESLLVSPNDTLGLSYVRAIQQHNYQMTPYAIHRQNSHHHDQTLTQSSIASGSAIRHAMTHDNPEWQHAVPASVQHLYTAPHIDKADTFPYLKYTILSQSTEALSEIYTMSEGLEYRLKKVILEAQSFDHLIQLLKSKRYTYTHLQRVLMNTLLQFKQQDRPETIPAARILGMTPQGQQYLKELKHKFSDRHWITNVNQQNASLIAQNIHATRIYNLISSQQQDDFNTPVIRSNAH